MDLSWYAGAFGPGHTMQPAGNKILQYQSHPRPSRTPGWFPFGTLSLALGLCAAIGIPIIDTITDVPGFVQGPILATGFATAVLAMACGIGAMFMAAHRRRGIIGTCLGFAGLVLSSALARA
jgi:hypothetical protein